MSVDFASAKDTLSKSPRCVGCKHLRWDEQHEADYCYHAKIVRPSGKSGELKGILARVIVRYDCMERWKEMKEQTT